MIDELEKILELYNINVSRETLMQLQQFYDLLLKWNKKTNLVSDKTIGEIWQRHVLDSAQLLLYMPNLNVKICDFGSGAGFPGLILSFCGIRKSILIESEQKKAVFLTEAAKISTNKVIIYNNRIEQIKDLINIDFVVSRAMAPLDKLLDYISKSILINQKTVDCLFLKGKNYQEEINNAYKKYDFNYVIHKSLSSDEGAVVEIKNFK